MAAPVVAQNESKEVMESERDATVCSLGRAGVKSAESVLFIHWRPMETNIFFIESKEFSGQLCQRITTL